MEKYNFDFVEKYNYPHEVREHFELILRCFDLSKVRAVLLTGSIARGELTYRKTDGCLSIFSDYEFVVVTKSALKPGDFDACKVKIAELEQRLAQKNPLFHIDFSFIMEHKLRKLLKSIWTYEFKTNNIAIYGDDLAHLMPDISADNLDYKGLNEIMLWKLWLLLLYLPQEMLLDMKMTESKMESYKYVICRQCLDLGTWLLPMAGILLPSYVDRGKYIQSHYGDLFFNELFGSDFPDFLDKCLSVKLKLEPCYSSLEELYEITINYFCKALIVLLKEVDVSKMDLFLPNVEKKSSDFFVGLCLKKIGMDLFFLVKEGSMKELFSYLNCAIFGKYGRLLHFLYRMHLAMLSHLKNNEVVRNQHILFAENILRKMTYIKDINPDLVFAQKWLCLRKIFVVFMCKRFKLNSTHIYNVMRS